MNVRGQRPELVEYAGPAAPLQQVWVAVRANLRAVLEVVTLADLAAGRLPDEVAAHSRRPRRLASALQGVKTVWRLGFA